MNEINRGDKDASSIKLRYCKSKIRIEVKEWIRKEYGGYDKRHACVHVKWTTLEGNSNRKISRNEEKNMNKMKKNTHDYQEFQENNEDKSADTSRRNNSELSETQQGSNSKCIKKSKAQIRKGLQVRTLT